MVRLGRTLAEPIWLARGSPPNWIFASQNWLFGVDGAAGALRLTLPPGACSPTANWVHPAPRLSDWPHVKAMAGSTGPPTDSPGGRPDGHCLDLYIIARASRS